MCIRLLYQMLILASIFCQYILFVEPGQCPPINPEAQLHEDFWPLAKKLLLEENGAELIKQADKTDQNDDDNKLISDLVDDLEAKDKQMEQEVKLQELCMTGNSDQNDQNLNNVKTPKESKIEEKPNKKWFQHRRFNFRRSNTMKNINVNEKMISPGQQQEQSRIKSSSSKGWLRTLSLRRPTYSKLNIAGYLGNSDAVMRSYSMRQNPSNLEQMLNDDKNCENDRKLGLQLYKESKQLQREILGGKNDPKCMVAKFGAIKKQIFNLMDIVAAKFGITMKKEYESKETEKPAKYGTMAMVKKLAKVWITVGKGQVDKSGMAKVLDMMRDVMVMAESKLVLPNPNGSTHRRRKRMEPLIIVAVAVLGAIAFLMLIDFAFFKGVTTKTILRCECF